jgi:hypothetical protein
MLDDNIGQGELLFLAAFLKAALHYAASMLMRADFDAVGNASIKNELGEALEALRAFNVRLFWVL